MVGSAWCAVRANGTGAEDGDETTNRFGVCGIVGEKLYRSSSNRQWDVYSVGSAEEPAINDRRS